MSKKKTREEHQKLADLLAACEAGDMTYKDALLAAGYTEAQAAKGKKAIPQAVIKMLPQNLKRLIEIGKRTTPEDMRSLVHGRLVSNVTEGTDKGAQSAKILGGSRDVNMWTPDSQMGLIIRQAPQSAIDNRAKLLADPDEED